MKGGEIFYPEITVKNGGVPVTGLVLADFVATGRLNATTPTISFTVTEIGSGVYRLAVTTPATILPAWFNLVITTVAGYTVLRGRWAGMLRARTVDDVYNLAAVPVVTGGANDLSLRNRTLELIAYRYKEVAFTLLDQSDNPIDLSGYNNWRFSVWTKTHSGSIYTLSSGITGSALGAIAFAVPEDAAFFSNITAAIAAGEDFVTLYWDLVADKASTAIKSETILYGQLPLWRFESPAA